MHSDTAFANALNAKMEAFPLKVYMGNVDGERIYMTRPSFDCNWYWGFGYLGNRNCHYHLDGIGKGENINFRDALVKHFGESFIIKDDRLLWQFAEVVRTIYTMKKAAEMFHMGGSHMTTNPDADTIKSKSNWEQEINEVLIPRQIAAMYEIIEKAKKA
jgi:hypothetical protein